jgi:hypothetical protein
MGEAVDMLRKYLAGELIHHPHVAREVVDEYEEVCADAGRYLARIVELEAENAALRKRAEEAESRVVEKPICLSDEQKARLTTRGEIPSAYKPGKWWKL